MKKLTMLLLFCFCIANTEAQDTQEKKDKKSKKAKDKQKKELIESKNDTINNRGFYSIGDPFKSDTIKVPFLDIHVKYKKGNISKEAKPEQDDSLSAPDDVWETEFSTMTKLKYHALLIGVSDYLYEGGGVTDLRKPIWDAKNLRRLLLDEYAFDSTNVTLLENPKNQDIINALKELAEKATAIDNVLIFYAGHGIYDPIKNAGKGMGYWWPADVKSNDDKTWLSNAELIFYLSRIQSKHTLVIADACFSGGIFRARSEDENANPLKSNKAPKNIRELYDDNSRKAMTSSTSNTVVPDESVFMQYLLGALQSNLDDFLAADDLFMRVKKATMNHSNSRQTPQYGEININGNFEGNLGGEFIFMKKNVFK